MSALDDIRASLDAAGNAIDRADSQVVLAMDEAQNATQDFSDLGLDGVAATVQAAHDALETAASTLTGAHDACEGASSGLGEIHSRISTSETVTRIGSVVGELDQTAAAVGTAGSNVDDAHNHSQQAEVDSLIDAIGNAADSIDTARQAVTQTKTPGRAVPAAHRGSRAGKPVGAGSAQPPAPPPNLDQQPHLRWPGYPAQRTLSWSDRIHLLYGDELDEDSGGHLYGTNRPNKTEFPPD